MRGFKEYIDSGPFPRAPVQDRRPDLVNGGIGDKDTPKPMRRSATTSAFPTYELPGMKPKSKNSHYIPS